jgi:hypothetical protein
VSKDEYLDRLLANHLKDKDFENDEKVELLKDKIESYIYDRSMLELWCDKHNHKLSLIRTLLSGFNLIAASLVALKVFEVI